MARLSDHPLVKTLYPLLRQDVQRDVMVALQVAVLAAQGFTRGQITRIVDAQPREIRDAWERLERIAPLIDRDSDF